MSIKQDRTGTRTSEDLRRRINVSGIEETKEKADASLETVEKIAKQVEGLNHTVQNTRETYVSTNVQTFTEEQKTVARENIGAGNSSFSGSYKDLADKPTKLSDFTNDKGFITDYVETDPTVPTHVKNITLEDISKWNSGTGGGGGSTINVNNEYNTSTTDTYSCDYINKTNTYSTEETFTGEYWVDGKKIYRKVVKYTTTSTIGATGTTTNVSIPHSIANFNEIINCTARRSNNPLPSIGGWSATDRATYVSEVNATNINLRIINDDWSAGSTFTFVIKYTKTTD